MITLQSKGGQATAIKLRRKALEKYYKDPNYCKACNILIEVLDHQKIRTAKEKKFCSHSCAAIYNNRKRKKKVKPKVIKIDALNLRTKGELFESRSSWQSARSSIQRNARKTFKSSNRPKKCVICGYDIHYDVAHIKSVSSFSNDILIEEINDISNLIALCPNHHWEFDNGLIDICG